MLAFCRRQLSSAAWSQEGNAIATPMDKGMPAATTPHNTPLDVGSNAAEEPGQTWLPTADLGFADGNRTAAHLSAVCTIIRVEMQPPAALQCCFSMMHGLVVFVLSFCASGGITCQLHRGQRIWFAIHWPAGSSGGSHTWRRVLCRQINGCHIARQVIIAGRLCWGCPYVQTPCHINTSSRKQHMNQ